jgi:hypothetical protein
MTVCYKCHGTGVMRLPNGHVNYCDYCQSPPCPRCAALEAEVERLRGLLTGRPKAEEYKEIEAWDEAMGNWHDQIDVEGKKFEARAPTQTVDKTWAREQPDKTQAEVERLRNRWKYIKVDQDGARALLLLLKNGKGTPDDFDTMVDRIIESRRLASVREGGK